MKSNLGNKQIMARNIRHYMELNSKSRNDMCEALGVKYTTFTDWVNGKTYPRIDKIELMANYFGITKAALVEATDYTSQVNADNEIPTSSSRRESVVIPVYGRVAAGIPLEMIEDIVDTEEIPEDMARTGTYFGLRIKGNSMDPYIEDGDTVIVRSQPDAESGDIVIATVNGDSATCKKLQKRADGIMLIPLNSSHDPIFFPNQQILDRPVAILGKVVELRRKV